MHLVAIVAMTTDRVIGRNGTLPWHLPEDLAFFKRTTSGHPIVMGRKTFESIGRPLPKRRNIVLTRDPNWSAPGTEVIHSPEDLTKLLDINGTVYLIGGAEIYQAFLPHTDEILVTHVLEPHAGDTYLPRFEDEFPHSTLIETHPQFEIRRWTRKPL
ncbi:MAG: dihydrofolate reductase [Verrucomicrobiia bacterium Tous-C5FEB]|nr:MAG: dihydrofolate reductase [Verrucomicrobiae bacterium Tous-C5FEB]